LFGRIEEKDEDRESAGREGVERKTGERFEIGDV
jgi:hypothetical protein